MKVDGRATFFEWISAGVYESGSERGTMAQVTDGVIRRIHLGFDRSRLLLRVDTASRAREDFDRSGINELRIRFVEPEGSELSVSGFGAGPLVVALNAEPITAAEAALGQTFELGVPLATLDVESGSVLKFFVEVFSNGQSTDRVPRETTLELTVPPPEFEHILWQV